jgi:uncharacterized DUF497 family protein
MVRIIWDEENAREHWNKHHISFDDAMLVFSDPFAITEEDDRFVYEERRYWTLGNTGKRYVLLYVAHTIEEKDDMETIRIISARDADPHERRLYDNRKL